MRIARKSNGCMNLNLTKIKHPLLYTAMMFHRKFMVVLCTYLLTLKLLFIPEEHERAVRLLRVNECISRERLPSPRNTQ